MKQYILFTEEELIGMLRGEEIMHRPSATKGEPIYFMHKEYFHNKEKTEETPDLGYVEFNDGHTEKVLQYTKLGDYLMFTTPSGKYCYESEVFDLAPGKKYRSHRFYDALTGKTADILTVVITQSK